MPKQPPHNPFDFNFGRAPEVWAGRTDLLAGIASYATGAVAVPFRQVLLYGTRGSGKTALLMEWLSRAEQGGWTVIDVSPEQGELIGDVVEHITEHFVSKGTFTGKLPKMSLDVLGAFKVGVDPSQMTDRVVGSLAGLLRQVAAQSGGWAHLVQLVGYYSVEAAGVGNRVTTQHVTAALPAVHDLAGKQLLGSAWRHVPRQVRWMLVALATHPTEVIARQAFLARTSISEGLYGKLLNSAVATGFVERAGAGRVVFPLPFVRGWVTSQAEREDFSVDDGLGGDAGGDAARDAARAAAGVDVGTATAEASAWPTYDYDLKRASADKIDALARRSKTRCSHIGVRSHVRCVLRSGHKGPHRY